MHRWPIAIRMLSLAQGLPLSTGSCKLFGRQLIHRDALTPDFGVRHRASGGGSVTCLLPRKYSVTTLQQRLVFCRSSILWLSHMWVQRRLMNLEEKRASEGERCTGVGHLKIGVAKCPPRSYTPTW